jgi:hypothetical protein
MTDVYCAEPRRRGCAAARRAARRRRRLIALALGQHHVVGGEAGLAGVQELGVEDARGGLVDVEVVGDDRRRLAAELERDRRQVLGGGAHDGAAGVGRAGEDQVIVGQRRELLGAHAGEDRDDLLGEDGPHLLGEEPAQVLRVGGHLDHHAVARGQRAGERADGEKQRVVPRRDDADDALGHRDHAVAAGGEQRRHVALLGGHPLLQVLGRRAGRPPT